MENHAGNEVVESAENTRQQRKVNYDWSLVLLAVNAKYIFEIFSITFAETENKFLSPGKLTFYFCANVFFL